MLCKSVDDTLELVRRVAEEVMAHLGAGHSEAVYHSAIVAALGEEGVHCRSEVCCPFMFRGKCVGFGKADVVIGNVIIEIKVATAGLSEHRSQLTRYMKALGDLEGRAFGGGLLVMNKSTGEVRLQAVDWDGDILFDTRGASDEEPSAEEKQPDTESRVYAAFRRRYKFVPRPVTNRGVSLARLRRNLASDLRGVPPEDREREISRFIERHFRTQTESRTTLRRRVQVCYPRDGGGVILA